MEKLVKISDLYLLPQLSQKYTIIFPRIGIGSFGEIFKVQRNKDKEVFAGKFVNLKKNNFTANIIAELKQSTKEELNILLKSNHPNIIQVFDSEITNDCIGIIMEYMDSGDLSQIIKNAEEKNVMIESQKIREIFYGVISALFYLESTHKIAHRDMKPGNILLGKNKPPKICDFNVSKKFNNQITELRTIVGTPLWMSPEMHNFKDDNLKQSQIDWTKADIFSFGLVGLYLVRPLLYSNFAGLMNKNEELLDKQLDKLQNPQDCVFLLKKMLVWNPEKRSTLKELNEFVRIFSELLLENKEIKDQNQPNNVFIFWF